jgi:predicted outer membrane protein
MKSALIGLATAVLACGVSVAQQPAQPLVQPAQGQIRQQPAVVQPAQPGQPGQRIQPGQPGTSQPGIGQPGQQAQIGSADQQIAAKIYGKCHNEVELAKFVQSRLQGEEAKQFAAKMIKDHTPDCEAYQKFAGNLVSHQQHGAGGQAAGGQAGGQRAAGGQADWVSIHNELAHQCLESAKKELSQKQGAELDQCYLTQQAMAHVEMKDALTVLRKHASPQLTQQIDQSLEGVESHLKEVKQILEQMKDRPSERVSRRPEGNK